MLSTGASNVNEIKEAMQLFDDCGCKDVALLHCILNYPTENINANLLMIKGLQKEFPERVIGYSDHTMPDFSMLNLTTSIILGARIIEKHFTHDKTLPGNDHYHAMDVHDLKVLKRQIKQIYETFVKRKAKHS